MDDYIKDVVWVAVDTETTGTNPWKYELLEIGAVRFTLNGVIDRFECLIKPLKKQDPKSRAIHNISNEELESRGISLQEGLKKFIDFIEEDPVIFHNASFDLSFLSIGAKACKMKLPSNFYYDTLFLTRQYLPGLNSYSLENLRKHFNISTEKMHRALADAEATAYVLMNLFQYKYDDVISRRKLKSFLRYHRKLSQFTVSVPKNLDDILHYFNKLIQTSSLIKIEYFNPKGGKAVSMVIPHEVMIFNQKLMLKAEIKPSNEVLLIPLKNARVFDPDVGTKTIY